jgi:hypothetical protein
MGGAGNFSRMFTVDEANLLLPRIVPDVEELLATFLEIRVEIDAASQQAGVPVDSSKLHGHLEARGIAPRLFEKVKAIIERIQANGCLVNGPEVGLIDFPCLYGNEIVFLCWKHGEPRVNHWHRVQDGFAGRKPLLDASESEAGTPVH